MRKKQANKLIEALSQLLLVVVFFAFGTYYLRNRATFWTVVIGGLILFLLACAALIWFQRKRFAAIYNWHGDRDTLNQLKSMHPEEFESFIADLFSKLGFRTETVGGKNDGGIDVIAFKDGKKHFIQCKRFSTKQVGVGAMRDFYGAIADNLSNAKGYFITTNIFTLEAERFAEHKPIELIDGQKLLEYIHMTKMDVIPKNTEPPQDTCPRCGGRLILRRGKFGQFYGCSNFPKCQYTKGM